ncbi:thermonuclease family protein [Methanobrevibacter sp.]
MNKKTISLILLIIFIITIGLTIANTFLNDNNTIENQTGTITINNKQIHYENAGKCVEVIDGNTIQVYGIGKVQLTQIGSPDNRATQFVRDKCLGKTVYLNVDDEKPTDNYGRTLAIVYTDTDDINKELLENNLAKVSYFEPSEFKKGEV